MTPETKRTLEWDTNQMTPETKQTLEWDTNQMTPETQQTLEWDTNQMTSNPTMLINSTRKKCDTGMLNYKTQTK